MKKIFQMLVVVGSLFIFSNFAFSQESEDTTETEGFSPKVQAYISFIYGQLLSGEQMDYGDESFDPDPDSYVAFGFDIGAAYFPLEQLGVSLDYTYYGQVLASKSGYVSEDYYEFTKFNVALNYRYMIHANRALDFGILAFGGLNYATVDLNVPSTTYTEKATGIGYFFGAGFEAYIVQRLLVGVQFQYENLNTKVDGSTFDGNYIISKYKIGIVF